MNRVVVGKSNYELTKRLRARLRQLDFQITICLDHFERLKEVETVNRLLSLGVELIIVSESMDAYNRLNLEAISNIANITEIPYYTLDQALDILKERAEQTLENYTYSEDTLKKITHINQGNITLAFVLLKSLALKAESLDKKSLDEVELNYEVNNPNYKLNRDEKLLFQILE